MQPLHFPLCTHVELVSLAACRTLVSTFINFSDMNRMACLRRGPTPGSHRFRHHVYGSTSETCKTELWLPSWHEQRSLQSCNEPDLAMHVGAWLHRQKHCQLSLRRSPLLQRNNKVLLCLQSGIPTCIELQKCCHWVIRWRTMGCHTPACQLPGGTRQTDCMSVLVLRCTPKLTMQCTSLGMTTGRGGMRTDLTHTTTT